LIFGFLAIQKIGFGEMAFRKITVQNPEFNPPNLFITNVDFPNADFPNVDFPNFDYPNVVNPNTNPPNSHFTGNPKNAKKAPKIWESVDVGTRKQ